MLKQSFFVVLVLAVLAGVTLAYAAPGSETAAAAPSDLKQFNKQRAGNLSQMSIEEATKSCNESFVIKMDYLEEMNKTGSFPDESDVVPMCFVKCYLEKIGLMSDEGDINEERVMQMWPDSTKDMVMDCAEEMEKGSDICEKAYYITRCVMTRVLVDGRSKD